MLRAINDLPVKEVMKEDVNEFPLLELPNELITKVFSFLSLEDRMRARVTKRLDEIESKSNYFVEKLWIKHVPRFVRTIVHRDPLFPTHMENVPTIKFTVGSDSSDCIKRLTHVSIGSLFITLSFESLFHDKLFNFIKDLNVDMIIVRTYNRSYMDTMVNSFFLDLARVCKSLDITKYVVVGSEALHELYKVIIGGSAKLRKMRIPITEEQCIRFLALIGITYRTGKLVSNRNFEATKPNSGNEDSEDEDSEDDHFYYMNGPWTRIFDGNLEIYLDHDIFNSETGELIMKLHESKESLNKAKNWRGTVKVDISPEQQ